MTKLQDTLTSDELKQLKEIKPVNNVIHAPEHIYAKIKKVERAKGIKYKAIRGPK